MLCALLVETFNREEVITLPKVAQSGIELKFQVVFPLWCLVFFFLMLWLNMFADSPGGAVVKNPPANAGDTGSSPGPGRSHMPESN